MGWKILDIENANYLKLFLNNIVIYKENEKITIPISDIDVIIINNYKINISMQLINELSHNNILTIVCDNKHQPKSFILPIFGNYNTLKIFENQLNWNHTFKADLWQNIIKQKIENQANLLEYFQFDKKRILQIKDFKNNVKTYDVTNREGHASKVYWNTMYGINFTRHQISYVNSLLNYGYVVLYGYLSRSIIKKGLDPRISLFHKSFSNHFALSSDLVEPFRILIDKKVYEIYLTKKEDIMEHKKELINIFNTKIKINDNFHFVNNAIDIFVDSIVNQTAFPKLEFLFANE